MGITYASSFLEDLGLFGPITHRFSTPESRERDPPHTNTGPAGYRDCYAFEVARKVEVILIVDDLRRNRQPSGFQKHAILVNLERTLNQLKL